MEAGEILAFVIVALLAGIAASQVLERGRASKRWLRSMIVGGLGALIGQFLFELLDIDTPALLNAPITLADILVAFIGALLVIFILRSLKRL